MTKRLKPASSSCTICCFPVENVPGPGAPKKYCAPCAAKVKDLQIKAGVAKQRANKAGILYSVTSDDIVSLAIRQGWACARTKRQFTFESSDTHASPWSASLDRIDPAKGYENGNVRLVVWAYNLIKSDWADDQAARIIHELSGALAAVVTT